MAWSHSSARRGAGCRDLRFAIGSFELAFVKRRSPRAKTVAGLRAAAFSLDSGWRRAVAPMVFSSTFLPSTVVVTATPNRPACVTHTCARQSVADCPRWSCTIVQQPSYGLPARIERRRRVRAIGSSVSRVSIGPFQFVCHGCIVFSARGPHSRSLSLGASAPRSGRRRLKHVMNAAVALKRRDQSVEVDDSHRACACQR